MTMKKITKTSWTLLIIAMMLFTTLSGSFGVAITGIKSCAVSADEYLAEFLNSGYDKNYYTVYDGSNEENFMSMNGRKYYQGFKLKGTDYHEKYVTFNVENIKSITFTVAHIDNSDGYNATLSLDRDGKWWRNIDLTVDGLWQTIKLDVSGIKTLKFYINHGSYGFGDITIDGYKPSMTYSSPKYNSVNDMLNAGYNGRHYNTYDGTNEYNYFQMNGRQHYQGFKLKGTDYHDKYVVFNVENIKSITFTVAHIDNSDGYNATLSLDRDGKWWRNIDLTVDGLWQTIKLDVSGIKTLKFYINHGSYGFGDITIDNCKPNMSSYAPKYENDVDLLNAGYNGRHYNTYDGTNEYNYFQMSGKKYCQGFKLKGTDYHDKYVTFNVENIKSLTFTLGHIDNSDDYNAKLDVYEDGKLYYTISLSPSDVAKYYTLDLSKVKTLMFYLNKGSYGLGNVAINGDYSSFGASYKNSKNIISVDKLVEEEKKSQGNQGNQGSQGNSESKNFGDVNADGSINALDASLVLTEYAAAATGGNSVFTSNQKKSADVNKDGAIDALDASLILSYYAFTATGGTGSLAEFLNK